MRARRVSAVAVPAPYKGRARSLGAAQVRGRRGDVASARTWAGIGVPRAEGQEELVDGSAAAQSKHRSHGEHLQVADTSPLRVHGLQSLRGND